MENKKTTVLGKKVMKVSSPFKYFMLSVEKREKTILHQAAKKIIIAVGEYRLNHEESHYIELINANKEFLEIRDPENNTPLQLAIKNNNYDYALALLKCGASTKIYDKKGDECNILNTEEGSKVLCYFVLLNSEIYTDNIKYLLNKSADPYYSFNRNRFTIEGRDITLSNTSSIKLSYLFSGRCYISLKIFIDCGLNLSRVDSNGKTILDLLYESNNPDGQPYLLLENNGAKRSLELTVEDDVKSILNNDINNINVVNKNISLVKMLLTKIYL